MTDETTKEEIMTDETTKEEIMTDETTKEDIITEIIPSKIPFISWGEVQVDVGEKTEDFQMEGFKDVMIHPRGQEEWDWKNSNTKHNPGIQIADLEELMKNCTKIVILSAGMKLKLKLPKETKDWLDEQVKKGNLEEYHYLETNEAVDKFNSIHRKTPGKVGCLIHSTC